MPQENCKDEMEEIEKRGYNLTEHLGKGAFGDVWRVQKTDGSAFAIKRIRCIPKEMRRILRELGILRRLKDCGHPGVIRIHEAWLGTMRWTNQMLFMVLDDGGVSLSCYLYKKEMRNPKDPLPNRDAANKIAHQLTKQLCTGVAFLHSVSVIHRNLKPGNVVVSLFARLGCQQCHRTCVVTDPHVYRAR